MSGYLDEAARLAGLVDTKAMTDAEAEEEFCRYLTDNGFSITLVGARSILAGPNDPEYGPGKPIRRRGGHQVPGWCNDLAVSGDIDSERAGDGPATRARRTT